MPGITHGRFVSRFARVFETKLQQAATTPEAEEFCRLVDSRLDAVINLVTEPPRQVFPDASYALKKQHYPGLVVEVSHSQNRKNLSKRAKEIIVMSKCRVDMVVGFDIAYPNSKAVTYSVWRRHRPPNAEGGLDFAVDDNGPHDQVYAYISLLYTAITCISLSYACYNRLQSLRKMSYKLKANAVSPTT